jgi:hypothetical protein
MTDLPASGYWSDNSRTEGEQKQWGEDIRDFINQMIGGGLEEDVTISSGSVTPSRAIISVDTEGATASDTLDAIAQANFPEGSTILVRAANASRVVTINHNAGVNGAVLTKSGANIDLVTDQFLWLKRTGTTWEEVSQLDTARGTASTQDTGKTIGDVAQYEDDGNSNPVINHPNMPEVSGTAIVESGSNSDGYWVRYSDGTQICKNRNISVSNSGNDDGGFNRFNSWNWTYPKAFSGTTPGVSGHAASGATTGIRYSWVTFQDVDLTQANGRALSAAGNNLFLGFIAVGAWT